MYHRPVVPLLLILPLLLPLTVSAQDTQSQHNLMPVPDSLQFKQGRLALTEQFTVGVRGHNDARLQAGIERMVRRLEAARPEILALNPQSVRPRPAQFT